MAPSSQPLQAVQTFTCQSLPRSRLFQPWPASPACWHECPGAAMCQGRGDRGWGRSFGPEPSAETRVRVARPVHVLPGGGCGSASTCSAATLPCAAVDEQNAQTQEQEGFILSLSESEKKDLKSDDRAGHGDGHSASKGRSLRRGTGSSHFGMLGSVRGYLVVALAMWMCEESRTGHLFGEPPDMCGLPAAGPAGPWAGRGLAAGARASLRTSLHAWPSGS